MNQIHLHLLVNHLPIFGAFLAVPLLVLTLLLRRERGLLLASVFLLVVAAIGGWASLWTGEKAMDALDSQDEKSWYRIYEEADVNEHEERAETATWIGSAAAVVGVVVLILAHRRPAENPIGRPWIALVLLGTLATAGAMSWAGNAGGVIMHREIRGDALDSTTPREDDHPK